MYARTTYAVGDPAEIDRSIEGFRTEAPKLLNDEHGFRSFGLFADRELGKLAMATWWETESDRAASDTHLSQRRTELLTPFADTVYIGNYDVVAFAATPQLSEAGAFRLGRFMIEADRIDDLVSLFKDRGVQRLQDLSGFCGAAMFIDREQGGGSVGTLFTDRSALAASRGPQSMLRKEAAQRAGIRVMCLEEFEVVLVENSPNAPSM
jgi:hypothetical protein